MILQNMMWSAASVLAWVFLTAPVFGADPADDAFQQAKQAMADGDYDSAIARLDEAIRQSPETPKHLGLRGVAWIRKGDYARGAADLDAAVRLNPGDAGMNYPPPITKKPSAEALRHGEEQVAAMLRDRPAMVYLGEESDFLRRWAASKFAGEDFGARIDWDPSPPWHSDAEHLAPSDDENAAILVEDSPVAKGADAFRSFEKLWSGAVYELHNVNFAHEFVRLNDEAEAGTISKTKFVEGILRYELLAAQQTRAFYLRVFLPWAERHKLPTDPALWFCDWWDTPETVLQSFTDKSAYPWRPYARTHDWAAVHRYWRDDKPARALKLLDQMCGQPGYEDEEADVHFWMGRCLERLGRHKKAVESYSDAIEFDPDHASAYEARGKLYEKLGEKEKAKKDLEKAKELEGGE